MCEKLRIETRLSMRDKFWDDIWSMNVADLSERDIRVRTTERDVRAIKS